jgi:hypothetical protein
MLVKVNRKTRRTRCFAAPKRLQSFGELILTAGMRDVK